MIQVGTKTTFKLFIEPFKNKTFSKFKQKANEIYDSNINCCNKEMALISR